MKYTEEEQRIIKKAAMIVYQGAEDAADELMQQLDDYTKAKIHLPGNATVADALLIWGGNECFDLDYSVDIQFYQYAVTANGDTYKLYYATVDDNGDTIEIDCIDYGSPTGYMSLGNVNA